jgi:predicted Zn-dependent protease
MKQWLAAFAITLLVFACATNPGTGRKQLMLVSEEQERAMGLQADKEVVAQYGTYADAALVEYVAGIGRDLAARSERPDLSWTFRVVDDPAVNAFALPGGYIYVTRGLLTHLSSEAQLASVLGHEIGHVTGRHSAAQMSQQQLATVGLVAGMVARPDLAERFGGLAQTGLGVLFLKFSRSDENEADELGYRYAGRAGYELREMPAVFRTLGGLSPGSDRLPGWLQTHPDPQDRVRSIEARLGAEPPPRGRVERPKYLRGIEGVAFGEDPREGFFRGTSFLHPEMRFRLDFPEGFKTSNQKTSVAALSPGEDAVVILSLAGKAPPEEAARAFSARPEIRVDALRRTRVNGLPAVEATFQAVSGQSTFAGRALFVSHEGRTFRVLGYGSPARFSAYEREIERSLSSFAPLRDQEALSVQPRRVSLVELERAMSLEEFKRLHPSTVSLETVALINQVFDGGLVGPGLVKRVTGGPTRDESNR